MATRRVRVASSDWAPEVVAGSVRKGWRRTSATHVILELAPSLFHRRSLARLPRSTRMQLQSMVALHADRYFPKASGPRITDARWIRKRGEAPVALAVAADEGMLNEFTRRAAVCGWVVDDILPRPEPDWHGLSLLPSNARQMRARRERARLLRSLALAVGGVVLAAGSRTLATLSELRRAERDVASSTSALAAIRHARDRENDRAHLRALVRTRDDAMASAATLFRAVAASCDSTVLDVRAVTFRVDGPNRLEIVAPSASDALEALQHNLRDVRWRAIGGPQFVQVAGERWSALTIELQQSEP